MHQLVHDDVSEERIEGHIALVGCSQHDFGNWDERLRELRVLHVLQHHAFRSLFANHALVVRQVERRRLHGAVAVAGRENLVHDDDRGKGAELWISLRRIDRQLVLDVLQLAAEFLELRALGFILNGDVGLERGLVVEQLVFVDLVRTDRRFDRAFQLHPRDVAVVIVVGQERVSAFREKGLERRLTRQASGFMH